MSTGAASSTRTNGHVAAPAQGHGAEEIRAHVKVYMMVFGVLAILTVVTVGAHYLHVPVGLAITIALLIASIKGSLVALYFMHLKGEVRAIFWTLLLTAVFFLAVITIPLSWYLDGPKHAADKAAAPPPTTHGAAAH